MFKFITPETEEALLNSSFSVGETKVPNRVLETVSEAQKELLEKLHKALGLDYDPDGYVVRVVAFEDGKKVLRHPYVANVAGVASVVIGSITKPVDYFKTLPGATVTFTHKVLDVFLDDLEGSIGFTLMQPKADNLDLSAELKAYYALEDQQKANKLKVVYNKGQLALYLSNSFKKARPLGDFVGQTLTIVSYAMNRFGKYELTTDDGEVVRTNTSISNKLASRPEVSEKLPAYLTVNPSTKSTDSGHAIYPVDFKLTCYQDTPTFDFTLGSPVDSDTFDYPPY